MLTAQMLALLEDRERMDWFDWGREHKCPFLVGDLFLFFGVFSPHFCLLCCRDSAQFPP